VAEPQVSYSQYYSHFPPTTGKLTYDQQTKRLVLNGNVLAPGDSLDLHVFGYWIPGHIAQDRTGWFLLTLDDIGIRLRPGLLARHIDSTQDTAS
jgi:uncharacterized protein DUF5348